MNFVIVGGAGFIGSHLTELLLSQGHCITVVDNLVTGRSQNLPEHPQLTLLPKNILACQPEEFLPVIDGLVHLAAFPSVTESWLSPLDAHHNNLSTTLAAIQLCQFLRIPRFVIASSAAVYGDTATLPLSEEQLTRPISPYGLQKLASEQYGQLFSQHFGFSFVALRLFNVFGPRQRPDSAYSGVISRFANAMKQGLPITIYGDGSQTRDFIFVKDVAIAFSQALTAPLEAGSNLICNIGSGEQTSLLEVVAILRKFYPHWCAEIEFRATRLGDIRNSQADITKACQQLNFRPQWSVVAGLQDLVESWC